MLWMLDMAHAVVLHRIPLSRTPTIVTVDERTRHVFVLLLGVPTATGYVGGGISMLDGTTGTIVRHMPLGTPPLAAVIDPRRKHLVVLSASATAATISIFDTGSGQNVRTLSVGNASGPMAIHEGTGHLFVAAPGSVLMLDTQTGRVVTQIRLVAPITALAVAEHADRVYAVESVANDVAVLDARTGALRRVVTVVQDPQAVAVDEEDHRVFIASNDVSNGINSGVIGGVRTSHVFSTIITALRNAKRLQSKGMTGTISLFDLRKMQ